MCRVARRHGFAHRKTFGQFYEKLHGPPYRRRRRGRSGRLRARHPRKHRAGQRQSCPARSRLRREYRARKIAANKNPRRAFELARLRRLEQLSRVPQPGGSAMNSKTQIVFTGLGAVCGAGLTVEEIWNAIQNGRSAIAPIKQWDASKWPVRVAAEVAADNKTLVADRKLHKIISRTDLFGLYAADIAVQQSGLLAHREKM